MPLNRIAVITASILLSLCLSLGLLRAEAHAPLTFAHVRDLVKDHQIKRIEDLLPLLPEQYRSKFALIYKSESAQGASATQPRVILFGDSGSGKDFQRAQLILAFNGSPDQKGGQVLESIEYEPQAKKFMFRSIDFSSGVAKIHENPEQCMKCHSKSLHPNWDTYPLWPGAIGGNENGHSKMGPSGRMMTYYPDIEVAAAKHFLSSAPTHDRYRHLKLGPEIKNESMLLQALGARNVGLSQLFTTYNAEKVLAEITRSPEFSKFEKAFSAAIDNSPAFFSYLPDPQAAKLRYETRKADTAGKLESYFAERKARYLKSTGLHPESDNMRYEFHSEELETVTKLRLLAEDYLHIPTRDWSLTRFPDTYAFIGPEHGIHTLAETWSRQKSASNCSQAITHSISSLANQH